ncbi:unnamed protein product, partial [marine sediment metagenome]
MYSIGIAAQILGVCLKTLRRWEKKKQIKCFRTKGGHRRFSIQEIDSALKSKSEECANKNDMASDTCVIYGRVSSQKQSKRGDLERQIQELKSFAEKNHYSVRSVYKDIGSGLNTNRKGLWKLLNDCRKQEFST